MNAAVALAVVLSSAAPVVHHDVRVSIEPGAHRLDVLDVVTLPEPATHVELLLHAGLSPAVQGRGVIAKLTPGPTPLTERLTVDSVGPVAAITLQYAGVIFHPQQQVETEHQRAFEETPGLITAAGTYLAPESYWLPTVAPAVGAADPLLTGRIVAVLPPGWTSVSEGKRVADENAWEQSTPCDGLHLIAAPFVIAHSKKAGVDVDMYLRTADPALVARYTAVTGQYLQMYSALLGAYPYPKFALVENFWETGYGMPSFTLLGSEVVRFPFILHTSYPHELLHNWWGNGVFVDGAQGNWSEGLTAYLADHLHAEQEDKGEEYRRTALQRYMDFADGGHDFPLVQFTARSSAASEAVGYGKALMVLHMLRQHVGDAAFIAGLRAFYAGRRFTRATFGDLVADLSVAAGTDLAPFALPYLTRTGAPRILWQKTQLTRSRTGAYTLAADLVQVQSDAPFPMRVPVVVTLADQSTISAVAVFEGRSAHVALALPQPPLRVDADPFADTFRMLLDEEAGPALTRPLGAGALQLVLPTFASDDERTAWRAFAAALCGKDTRCHVVDDVDATLESDAAIWILGYGNKLRAAAVAGAARFGAHLDDYGFLPPGPYTRARLKAERTDPRTTSLVLALPHPLQKASARLGAAFVGAVSPAAIAALARKIPHYGKYAYLAFAGDSATNTLKGSFEPDRAPLTVFFGTNTAARGRVRTAALAELPPPFEAEPMLTDVRTFAAQGRAPGTAALRAARDAVAARFSALRLTPFDAAGFKMCTGTGAAEVCNVVAVQRGKDSALPPVLLSAHVDHLAARGKTVFPGADDNASGVAVLLEVARSLAAAGPGERDVIFAAFDGEEQGLLGSRSFAAGFGAGAPKQLQACVNLDTVGRHGDKPLLVLDGDSAEDWVHIVRGVGFTTGVKVQLAPQGGGASDQQACIDRGIPGIQLFSGPNADYHKPSDTADKVEGRSLVDAAVVAREFVAYLRDRKEPLPFARAPATAASSGAPRRAALGSVPDMTFQGPGVRFDSVVPGSAAAQAGLRAGDVLVRFDGVAVPDLRTYSELLKAKEPGARVKVTVLRGGAEVSAEVTLGARP